MFPRLYICTHENDIFADIVEWILENDLIIVVHREYNEMVVVEVTLTCLDFGETTWSFGCTPANRFSSLALLSFLNSSPYVDCHIRCVYKIAIRFHGDDGSSTTQLVLFLDFDHTVSEFEHIFERS